MYHNIDLIQYGHKNFKTKTKTKTQANYALRKDCAVLSSHTVRICRLFRIL